MFARPVKQLPGKWRLFEYYLDEPKGLKHVDEQKLKVDNENWQIEFLKENRFSQEKNLQVAVLEVKNGNWECKGNFIRFAGSENNPGEDEFQFAIDKGVLKLLKKNKNGNIDFFGFFRRLQ